jgi:hypothetical protein
MKRLSLLITVILLFGFTNLHSQTPNYVPKTGLIGWWPFNGNAKDESGNGNHGIEHNVQLTLDRNSKSNSAMFFDGKTSFVSIKNFGSVPISDSAITITGWVKTNHKIPEGESMFVCSARSNSATAFVINPDNLFICTFANSQGGFHNFYSDKSNIISDGKWHFFAMVYDGFNQKTYLDSTLIWNQYFPFDLLVNGLLEFGRDNPYGRHYNGDMDDIGIWNRALSEQEVKDLYDSKQNVSVIPDYVPKTGLIGWWPFNGNAQDESGNGNHGTPMNGVTFSRDRFANQSKAITLKGDSSYVVTSLKTIQSNSYTISCWFKTSEIMSNEIGLVVSRRAPFQSDGLYLGNTNQYIQSVSECDQASLHYNGKTEKYNDDKWHHFVSVFDGKYMFGYVDGKLFSIQNSEFTTCIVSPFEFGRDNPYGRYFKGDMDDIGIWSRALDSNEVYNLFRNTKLHNVKLDSLGRANITKAINLGGNGNDDGLVVCEDYAKNILITGNYTNSIDVFPGDSILLFNSVGLQNSYLLKIDSNFNYIHSIPIQGDFITCTRNVTVDKYNNYYIGGFFRRSITFKFPTKDTILRTPDNYSDVFIAKYNPNGILQWVRQLKSDRDDDISGMKVSDDGVLFTTGYCGGTIDLNPSNGQDIFTTKGVDDAYVVKLSTDGDYLSGFILGSTGSTYGGYILPEIDNHFYLSGSFSKSIQLVSQNNEVINLSSNGELDGFLIKYDSTNKAVWTKTMGGSRNDGIGQCSFDKEQNLVFASSFSDSIKLKFNSNQISIKSKGDQDILLAKCDSVGNVTWYSTIGSPKKDNLFHFSIDNNNFLHSYSKVNDSLIVSDSIIFLNTNDYYSLITYDSSGRMKKGYSIADFYGNWETPENERCGYVFYPSRHSGELIVSGFYTDSVRFYNESDSITLKSNGSTDAFVARLVFAKEIQSHCSYSIKESDTTVCRGTTVELNAIQTSSINSEIPKIGLIGWWPFNGNANDESGNGNHGLVKGASLAEDRCKRRNAAYEFNGIDNLIEVANSESLSNVESITMSAWVLLDSMRQQYQGICTKWWQGVNCTKNSDTYCMSINNHPETNNQTKLVCGTNNYSNYQLQTSNPIPEKKWVHLLFVHNNKTGGKLYLNSELAGVTGISGSICQSTNPLLIGADNNQGSYWRFFDGKIDDIAIWNRPLSDSEVVQVYNAGSCNCIDTLPENKFTWSTGQKGRKISVSPNTSTMYTLEVERDNQIDRDTIHVKVLESPTPDIFGHIKVYERQVNYSYYTQLHDSSTYEWKITGNGKISSTNGGSSILIDFKEPGYAYLTVSETNKYGCRKDTTITIRIYGITDIHESNENNQALFIYPNPMNEFTSLDVKAYLPPSSRSYITISDMLGKTLQTIELGSQDSYSEVKALVSTEGLTNGVYMIQLHVNGNVISDKVIINR